VAERRTSKLAQRAVIPDPAGRPAAVDELHLSPALGDGIEQCKVAQ
jgi:hypothetical protein